MNCPLCGSEDIEDKAKTVALPPTDEIPYPNRSNWREKTLPNGCKCRNCGLHWPGDNTP